MLVEFENVEKQTLRKSLGDRIIQLRLEKGWSQSDLARAAEKDRQAIEKIENGKVNATVYSVAEIAKALDVSLSQLFEGL